MQSRTNQQRHAGYELQMTEELFGQIMQRMRKVPFQLRELAPDAYVNVPRTDVLACAVVGRAVSAVTAVTAE
jgi:hypothetical protein